MNKYTDSNPTMWLKLPFPFVTGRHLVRPRMSGIPDNNDLLEQIMREIVVVTLLISLITLVAFTSPLLSVLLSFIWISNKDVRGTVVARWTAG